jgi:hypothetical protein
MTFGRVFDTCPPFIKITNTIPWEPTLMKCAVHTDEPSMHTILSLTNSAAVNEIKVF